MRFAGKAILYEVSSFSLPPSSESKAINLGGLGAAPPVELGWYFHELAGLMPRRSRRGGDNAGQLACAALHELAGLAVVADLLCNILFGEATFPIIIVEPRQYI